MTSTEVIIVYPDGKLRAVVIGDQETLERRIANELFQGKEVDELELLNGDFVGQEGMSMRMFRFSDHLRGQQVNNKAGLLRDSAYLRGHGSARPNEAIKGPIVLAKKKKKSKRQIEGLSFANFVGMTMRDYDTLLRESSMPKTEGPIAISRNSQLPLNEDSVDKAVGDVGALNLDYAILYVDALGNISRVTDSKNKEIPFYAYDGKSVPAVLDVGSVGLKVDTYDPNQMAIAQKDVERVINQENVPIAHEFVSVAARPPAPPFSAGAGCSSWRDRKRTMIVAGVQIEPVADDDEDSDNGMIENGEVELVQRELASTKNVRLLDFIENTNPEDVLPEEGAALENSIDNFIVRLSNAVLIDEREARGKTRDQLLAIGIARLKEAKEEVANKESAALEFAALTEEILDEMIAFAEDARETLELMQEEEKEEQSENGEFEDAGIWFGAGFGPLSYGGLYLRPYPYWYGYRPFWNYYGGGPRIHRHIYAGQVYPGAPQPINYYHNYPPTMFYTPNTARRVARRTGRRW